MSTATCCRTGLPNHGSRTVPIGTAKMQVNDSVDLGGHNKNRRLVVEGSPMTLSEHT